MSLHLVELSLNLRDLHVWAGRRNLAGGGHEGYDEGRVLHHLLGETFGPSVLQPFRLMVSPGAGDATLYAYAAEDAAGLRAGALASLTPGQGEMIRLDRIRSLPRPASVWKEGQRVGFDLRMRPVVRLHRALIGRNEAGAPVSLRPGSEVDAFLARCLRGEAVERESVYRDWLAERLGDAARLEAETTRLASFRRVVVLRKGRRIEGPDAVLHGTLVVVNPAAFMNLLARGIGRHRAYGYGMLLLRPPQRTLAG